MSILRDYYEVDFEQFWKDDVLAHEENCFSKNAPQVALGLTMGNQCAFAELGEDGPAWGYVPRARRIEINKRYNDKAEKIVGKRLLQEEFPPEDASFPKCKEFGEIFGAAYKSDGNYTWMTTGPTTLSALEKKLDEVEKIDLRAFVFPQNWEEEKRRIFETYGIRPPLFRKFRGPTTFAMQLYGSVDFIYLVYDGEELLDRFRDVLCATIIRYVSLFDEEAGYTSETRPHGFSLNDDDISLLTPEMFLRFSYPIYQKLYDTFSPNPGDLRYLHSDADMGHQLPYLTPLQLTAVNLGPKLTVREIRKHLPIARIDGQLAPYTFMHNDTEEIIRQCKRDFEMAREGDLRGLNFKTAGATNEGSSLESLRLIMHMIQTYGRY